MRKADTAKGICPECRRSVCYRSRKGKLMTSLQPHRSPGSPGFCRGARRVARLEPPKGEAKWDRVRCPVCGALKAILVKGKPATLHVETLLAAYVETVVRINVLADALRRTGGTQLADAVLGCVVIQPTPNAATQHTASRSNASNGRSSSSPVSREGEP